MACCDDAFDPCYLIDPIEYNKEQCSICYDNLNNGKRVIYGGCLHLFHQECINTWVTVQGQSTSNQLCPLCRRPFYDVSCPLFQDIVLNEMPYSELVTKHKDTVFNPKMFIYYVVQIVITFNKLNYLVTLFKNNLLTKNVLVSSGEYHLLNPFTKYIVDLERLEIINILLDSFKFHDFYTIYRSLLFYASNKPKIIEHLKFYSMQVTTETSLNNLYLNKNIMIISVKFTKNQIEIITGNR